MAHGIPRKQFEVWLRNQLYILTDRGKCTRIVLRRATVSSRLGQEVLARDVPQEEGEPDDNWTDDMTSTIENIAQADANGCGAGTQKYLIQVHHEGSDKATAGFTVRLVGDGEEDNDEIFSEPATKQGLFAQLMRHNEVITRISSTVQATALGTMQKVTAKQEIMIDKLLEEKYNNLTILEQLLSQKQERDLEAAKVGHKMEMQDTLVSKLMLLAPTVINKLSGGGNSQKLIPEKTTPAEQQIASLAESMSEEQLAMLQKVFTMEQMIVWVDLFGQASEKQAKLVEQEHAEK